MIIILTFCTGCLLNDNYLNPLDISAQKLSVHEGFDVPECCYYHEGSDRVFVSNIVSAPDKYWDNDNKGHIGLHDFSKPQMQFEWLKSATGQIIHSPKGMTVLGAHLYFTDNSRLMRCDLKGKNLTILSSGFEKANDLANDGKNIWLTDTQASKVYCISPKGKKREVPSPEAVNGVTCHNGKVFAVSWGLHEVYELDPEGKNKPVSFGLSQHFTNLDGIEILDNGVFLVSDFKGNKISTISSDRKTVKTLIQIDSPADIGLDRARNLLFVPLFMKNKVVVYQLK